MSKKHKKTDAVIQPDKKIKTDLLSKMNHALKKHERWLPWVTVSIYFIAMAWLTLRYHTTGDFGVETDFYAELAHQSRQLLRGDFSVMNYGPKGPVYSFILAGVYLVVRDYFLSGLLINLISSFVFLIVLFYLIKLLFNRITAFVVILAIAFNFSFQSYTYQAGSDLPFMATSILSIFFLFRSEKRSYLILSAAFGLLAFLTRYNGAFIVAGSMLYLVYTGGTFRDRLKRIGLWMGVFLCLGLPWFIPNFIIRGNPVFNSNYMNVMIEFYGIGQEGFSTESWYAELPEKFSNLGDVVFYDPVHFVTHLIGNIVTHFLLDIQKMIGSLLGIFIVLGSLMLFIAKPGRKRLLYLSFGVVYFLILTLVFYSERFSMFLLASYFPFGVWPFTERKPLKYLRKFSFVPVMIIILLVAASGYTSTRKTLQAIKSGPLTIELKQIGKLLDSEEPDKSQKIIA